MIVQQVRFQKIMKVMQEIKARHEVLNDFVKNLNTIKWQDRLLLMSNLILSNSEPRSIRRLKQKKLLAEKKDQQKEKGFVHSR
jgi:hypothetical protein